MTDSLSFSAMRSEDHYEVARLLRQIGGDDSQLKSMIIDGRPPSKARHRHGNGRTYRTKKDIEAERFTATHLRGSFREPFTGNVALICLFYRDNYQRIDTDNMLKHVCDAANGIMWHDDSQVTAIAGLARYDKDDPRTVIGVTRHVSTLSRGADATYPCSICGNPISRIGRTRKTVTCSVDCATRARGNKPLSVLVPCEQCGEPFRRTTQASRFCSVSCRQVAARGKPKKRTRALSICTDCGKQLAHARGGRCRECWRASLKHKSPTTQGGNHE